MKTCVSKKHILAILSGIVIVATVYAKDEEFVKEFKQSYETNKNTNLVLDNKYGNIDINNWNENRISISIIVKVKAVSKEKAEEMFNKIDISIFKEGDEITARTDFSDDFGKVFNNRNNLLEIKYNVNMPSIIPLDLSNKYGNVFINELKSTSIIDVKYGNLKANRIIHNDQQPFTEIRLGYSNATIQTCTWTKFDIKYSNIEMSDTKALIILSKYSKINVEKGTSIVTESKYDTYRLGRISNIVATAGYSNFKAEAISNKIQMDTKYTDMNVSYVPVNFEEIKLNTSYGNYKILLDPEASYKIDGYAKYAKVFIPESARVNRFNENNEYKVNGTVGNNQATKSKISVSSNYGNIKFVE